MALVGSNVTLNCLQNHMNKRHASYEWRKDEDKIDVKNGTINNPFARILKISNVSLEDSGNYSCIIANASNWHYSVLTQLVVLGRFVI